MLGFRRKFKYSLAFTRFFETPMQKGVFLFIPLALAFALGSCSAAKFAMTYISYSDGKSGEFRNWTYYTNSNVYRVAELSADWKKVSVEEGDLVFHDAIRGLVLAASSFCGAEKRGLKTLADSLAAGIANKKMTRRTIIDMGEGEGLYTEYETAFDGEKFGLATVVYKSGKCDYDFSYSASATDFRANMEEFFSFLSGFKELRAK